MAMMYVVTMGSYSDYRIVAVFSEDYQIVAEKLAASVCGDVEVYELNPVIAFPKLRRWEVIMGVDGNNSVCRQCTESYDECMNLEDLHVLLPTQWKVYTWEPYNVEVTCWAKHKKRAIKIANEYRTRLITFGVFAMAQSGRFSKNFITEDDVAVELRSNISIVDVVIT